MFTQKSLAAKKWRIYLKLPVESVEVIPRLIAIAMAFLLLAAHFLRYGNYLAVGLCLLAPFTLLIKKRWARLLVQSLLYLGAVIWLHTTLVLTHARVNSGSPWRRMLVILGLVTVFTLIAGILLGSKRVKQKYP